MWVGGRRGGLGLVGELDGLGLAVGWMGWG